jgi:hypothetical protein
MRIDEIASAEDQIALFKLITDKVWQALGDQHRAEAETKARQPLKAKFIAATPKKPKAPAARPVPKPTIKATPSAKPKPQPARGQPFAHQWPNSQVPSTKQKQNANLEKEPESAGFDELDIQKFKTAPGKERHSKNTFL